MAIGTAFRLTICAVVAVATAAAADPTEVRWWRDTPSEALRELNRVLPAGERVAWYVSPALDQQRWPGTTLEASGDAAALLAAYAEAAGVSVSTGARGVWLHQAPAATDGLTPAALLAADHPAALSALIAAGAVAGSEARPALAAALGLSNRELTSRKPASMTLFGHPNQALQRTAPLGVTSGRWSAPWLAAEIALQDPAAQAAVTAAVAASDQLTRDLPLLVLATLIRAPEAKAALSELRGNPQAVLGGNWARWENARVGDGMNQALETFWLAPAATGVDVAAAIAEAESVVSGLGRKDKGAKLWRAFDAVALIDDPQVVQWLKTVIAGHSQGHVRSYAVGLMRRRGEAAQAELVALLLEQMAAGGGPAETAIQFLAQMNVGEAADGVVAWMHAKLEGVTATSEDRQVRGAVRALDRVAPLDHPTVHAGLATVAHEGAHQALREQAIVILGGSTNPDVVPLLAAAFADDPQPRVRRAAASAMAATRQPAAIDALVAATEDASTLVRGHAVGALAGVRAAAVTPIIAAQLDATGIEPGERQLALQYAGLSRDPTLAERLVAIAQGTGPSTDRQAAVVGLLQNPTERVRTVLAEVATSADEAVVRRWAIRGFVPANEGAIGQCLPTLVAALATERDGENLALIIDGLLRCADGLPRSDSRSTDVATAMLAFVSNGDIDGNLRKQGLAVFGATANTPEIIAGLEAAAANERHPVMRRFIGAALAKARGE